MKLDAPPGTITEFVYQWRNWLNLLYEWLRDIVEIDFESTSTAVTISKSLTLVDTNGGAVTVTLPPVANHENRVFTVKDVDSGASQVTIDGDGAETIDGATTLVLSATRGYATVMSDGAEWHRIG